MRIGIEKGEQNGRGGVGAHHDAELARAALCVAIAIRGGSVADVWFAESLNSTSSSP